MRLQRLKRPAQHLEPDHQFLASGLLPKKLKGPGQQTVVRVKRLCGLCRIQFRRARQAGQQHRVGHGLGVGIRELGVVGIGEEELPPLVGEKCDRRSLLGQRVFNLGAQEASQGREVLGQRRWLVRHDRFPAQERL